MKGQTGKVPAVGGDEAGAAEAQEDGDDTRRVKRVVHEEIASNMATVRRIQFWATVGMLVAGLGFSAAMFLSRYATAADLDKLGERQADTRSLLEQHMVNEAAARGAIESQARNIESDYHSVREQLWKIADRVGASRVALPAHDAVITVTPSRPVPAAPHP